MTRRATIRTIKKEIKAINKVIDLRIIKGLSYKEAAQKHRILLAKLSHAKRKSPFGWSFQRAMKTF